MKNANTWQAFDDKSVFSIAIDIVPFVCTVIADLDTVFVAFIVVRLFRFPVVVCQSFAINVFPVAFFATVLASDPVRGNSLTNCSIINQILQ